MDQVDQEFIKLYKTARNFIVVSGGVVVFVIVLVAMHKLDPEGASTLFAAISVILSSFSIAISMISSSNQVRSINTQSKVAKRYQIKK